MGGPRLAMRFHEADEQDVQDWIDDPDIVFEQKMDGTRVLAIITKDGVDFRQSAGRPLTHAAAKVHLPALTVALGNLMLDTEGEMVLDGELLTRSGRLYLFDMPHLDFGGEPLVKVRHPFRYRRSMLAASLSGDVAGSCVTVVPQARSAVAKRGLFEAVREQNGEGVIAKHLGEPYEPGKRVRHTAKIKLVKTADVIVTAVERPDARHGSFTFGVVAAVPIDAPGYVGLGEQGPGQVLVQVLGKCSAVGKAEARVGDVIEVAYLYREQGTGGLVQPRMVRKRMDKGPAECTVEQFPQYSREPVAWDPF